MALKEDLDEAAEIKERGENEWMTLIQKRQRKV
jgi:hypothetical protein